MDVPPLAPRAIVLACSLSALCALGRAQSSNGPSAPHNPALPPDLLPIPAGKVTMGLEAKDLVEVAKSLSPQSESARLVIIRNCLTELGLVTVDVETCYMAKHPVTNEQYKIFVEKTGARFPFHWWAEGRKDDFESKERMEAIAKLPQAHDKNVVYWEQNWKTLPWAIPAGQEKHPVVNVSWRDAVEFAAWAGMRLPSEAEWTRAALGDDKPRQFLLGDTWNKAWLADLRLEKNSDRRGTKPVGSISQAATGKFGHDDMIGGVWEWMFDSAGYVQRSPRKEFEKELDKLKKLLDKNDLSLDARMHEDHRILKGGCFISALSPVELRIGVRAHLAPNETQPGAGFRLAKSVQPARDMARSRIRIEYDWSFFGNRKPNLDDQVGMERYTLKDGLIHGYAAVTIVPISDMGFDGNDQEGRRKTPEQHSQEQPAILGTLLSTEKLQLAYERQELPKLEPGIYTVFYRPKGLPADLTQALRTGQKELQLAAKEKAAAERDKDKKKKPSEKEKEKAEKPAEAGGEKADKEKGGEPDWRAVVQKYGVTEQEVLEHGAKLKTLRMRDGDYAFPIEDNLFLFRLNEPGGGGRFVAHLPTRNELNARGGYRAASLALEPDKDDQLRVKFTFGVPKGGGTHYVFELPLGLAESYEAHKSWNLPVTTKTVSAANVGGAATNGNGPGAK